MMLLLHDNHLFTANSRIASSALRDEFERSTDDLQRRHKDEMKSLHERLNIEKQAWQENYMKKQVKSRVQILAF